MLRLYEGCYLAQKIDENTFGTINSLRKIRNKVDDDSDVMLSACDPLNLQGVLSCWESDSNVG